jgi:hypothetical protein
VKILKIKFLIYIKIIYEYYIMFTCIKNFFYEIAYCQFYYKNCIIIDFEDNSYNKKNNDIINSLKMDR